MNYESATTLTPPLVNVENALDGKVVSKQIWVHLSTLAQNESHSIFHFRMFNPPHPPKSLSTADRNWEATILGAIQNSYQVYVTVNRTDTHGVKTENINGIRALFIDFDKVGNALALIEDMPLPPNLVVNTSPSKFHAYWIIDDCPVEEFKGLQKKLAKKYGGDPSVCDLPRVMRLAGSQNLKSKPHFVTVISSHDDSYTLDEFKRKFDLVGFVGTDLVNIEQPNNYTEKTSLVKNITNIIDGDCIHDSSLSLACQLAHKGLSQSDTFSILNELYSESKAARDNRFSTRRSNLTKVVFDAFKYNGKNEISHHIEEVWPEPEPLEANLSKVLPCPVHAFPKVVGKIVEDESCRINCPFDFVAVSSTVMISSIVARNIVIQPKQHDTGWLVTPNLWGMLIGSPSTKKSPSMKTMNSILKNLSKALDKEFNQALAQYKIAQTMSEWGNNDIQSKARELFKKGNTTAAQELLTHSSTDSSSSTEPKRPRLVVNDTTTEKLGEIHADNHRGLLVYRDELSGWFSTLDKPDRSSDRALYLESFNGDSPYTYDRISRGTVEIDPLRLSILGGTQPGVSKSLFRSSISGGKGADGLIQRFQMAVYPDEVKFSEVKDQAPDLVSPKILEDKLGAIIDWSTKCEEPYVLTFTESAYALVMGWLNQNELLVRDPELHPALQSHFAKYPKLFLSLAAIIHTIDSDNVPCEPKIDAETVQKAIELVEYFKSHAERIYGMSINPAIDNAITLKNRLKRLNSSFTARDVQRKGWAGLDTPEAIKESLDILVDYGYLKPKTHQHASSGRPTTQYVSHPNYQPTKPTETFSSISNTIATNRSISKTLTANTPNLDARRSDS